MLGQVNGVFSLGEVREVWQSGVVENRPCGCGEPFHDCPFWREVGQEAFAGWGALDIDAALGLWRTYDRPWALPMLLGPRAWSARSQGLNRYRALLHSLYGAIQRVAGAGVLVDSSKLPTHALILRGVSTVDLRLVHLVRDSRAVVFSWERKPLYAERYSTSGAAARWLLYNEPTRLARSVGVPYRLLRYEDLLTDPRGKVEEVLRFAGHPLRPGDLSFIVDGEVSMKPNHTVDGNPMRFAVGPVRLGLDEEWRHKMSAARKVEVTLLTAPGLVRYGYPLRIDGRGVEVGNGTKARGVVRTRRPPAAEPGPVPLVTEAAVDGERRAKVLYIGGLGRSGSTLLDCMLGQLPGFFSGGEIRDLWQRGLRENRLCGCGTPFRSCPFWTKVAEQAFGGWEGVDLDRVQRLARRVDRHSRWPLTVVPWLSPAFGRDLREYLGVLARLYKAIHEVGGTQVIVDSSKAPSSAFLLRRVAGLDLRAVHLTRDSRGVAYSWTKKILRPDVPGKAVYMHRYPPLRIGMRWVTRNLLMETLGRLGVRSLQVRYEAVVEHPRDQLLAIARLLDEPVDESALDFVSNGTVVLGPNHTVMGNPVRLQRGAQALRLDEAWRSALPAGQTRLVTLLTRPMLTRYGYRP
jgi:Sulfotransferase family